MESEFAFVKYNEKLLKHKEELTPLEKYLIKELSDPSTYTSFEEPWIKQIINNLRRRFGNEYGDFTEASIILKIEGASDEEEEIIRRAVADALAAKGFVDYDNNNPFALNKDEKAITEAQINKLRGGDF